MVLACAAVVMALTPLRAEAQVFDPALHTGTGRPALTLSSPGGGVTVWLGVDVTRRMWYAVARDAVLVLEASPLGVTVDGVDLGASVTDVFATRPAEADETYAMHGNHRRARNHFNETTLAAYREGAGDQLFLVVVRVYDDGVAYRYVVPGAGPRWIGGEASAWRLPAESVIWAQSNTANYEAPYWSAPVGNLDADMGGPITVALPQSGGFAVFTEGGLRDYSGMTYHVDAGSNLVRSAFLDNVAWTVPGGARTPWRIVIVSATLNGLVNSDLVANVNDAPDPVLFPQGADTWFIRPGRGVWSWWADHQSAANYEAQQVFVEYAYTLRAEYVLLDAGWETGFQTADQDQFARLADLVDYARLRGPVRIWVWRELASLGDAWIRREFLRRVADAGAVGVKVDSVYGSDSESIANVQLQEAILRDAAEFRLMVNFHGIQKPTGLNRTYPNAITHEGFMGIEPTGYWFLGMFVPPWHNAVVPFTRMVAGAADYTPMTLDPRKLGDTTFAHQLATTGLFTSPIVHFAEDPALLLAQPAIRDVLRTLPTDWDETVVLPWSSIGQVAAIARRSGQRWWVFCISGDVAAAHTVALQLPFLEARPYDVLLVSDATKTSFRRDEHSQIRRDDAIDVQLLPGGGFVAVFTPAADLSLPVGQGFTSLAQADSEAGWIRSYATLRNHGNLVAHSLQEGVPWPEALQSSDPSTYPQNLRARWDVLRLATNAVIPGHARYLMVNPIDTANYAALAPYWGSTPSMPLPAPWDTYEFNAAEVKAAYLNYLVAAVEFFQPTYLATSIEANILLAHAPHRWAAFKDLHAYVYAELKTRYPSLKIFATVHYEHMRAFTTESFALAAGFAEIHPGLLTGEAEELLRHSDLLAVSTYPYMIAGNRYVSDAGVDADYYDAAYRLASAAGKQLAIDQTGYLTRDVYLSYLNFTFPGSEERQRQFLELVLHDAHVYGFAFVVNFVAWDYGLNYGTFPTSLTWAYTGLVREDGTPKPALATWDRYR